MTTHTPVLSENFSQNSLILARNGQSCSTFCATCSKYLSSIFRSHAAAEAMFVFPLSVRGLVSSFAHNCMMYLFCFCSILIRVKKLRAAKLQKIVVMANFIGG